MIIEDVVTSGMSKPKPYTARVVSSFFKAYLENTGAKKKMAIISIIDIPIPIKKAVTKNLRLSFGLLAISVEVAIGSPIDAKLINKTINGFINENKLIEVAPIDLTITSLDSIDNIFPTIAMLKRLNSDFNKAFFLSVFIVFILSLEIIYI